MKKIITFGVFDYFHIGHLKLFEQAKKYGDYLIVAVQDSNAIKKYKPDCDIFYSTEDRTHIVSSLSVVDEVCVYFDMDKDIKTFDFDALAVGEDQVHANIQRAVDWCKENNKEIIRLLRTPGVSSSQVKKSVSELI